MAKSLEQSIALNSEEYFEQSEGSLYLIHQQSGVFIKTSYIFKFSERVIRRLPWLANRTTTLSEKKTAK